MKIYLEVSDRSQYYVLEVTNNSFSGFNGKGHDEKVEHEGADGNSNEMIVDNQASHFL